jgi:hypothetical protein
MVDIRIKYVASAFVSAGDIHPTPDATIALLEAFRDKELLPDTFREITPPSMVPAARLGLVSPNNEWVIQLGSNRINIQRNPTDPKGNNLGTVSDFCADAIDLFGRILETFPKKPRRLALITEFLLGEMAESRISEVHDTLFNSPPFYMENRPFEWRWRAVSRTHLDCEGLSEKLNVVSNIARVQGQFASAEEVTDFDRVQVTIDINTIAQNEETRFGMRNIRSFYDQVQRLQATLLEELQGFING